MMRYDVGDFFRLRFPGRFASVHVLFLAGGLVLSLIWEHVLLTVVSALSGVTNALQSLCERVKQPRLFVFGDDLDWARRELPLAEGTQFVEHNGDDRNVEDLWLMTRCRHAIVANSSFSWWGAWLNADPNRVVIAPATWGYRAAAAAGWLTVDG